MSKLTRDGEVIHGHALREAVKWYRKAAEQGNAIAQCELGISYARGEGVVKDEEEGLAWMTLAATFGDSRSEGAKCQLERSLDKGSVFRARERAKQLEQQIEQNRSK